MFQTVFPQNVKEFDVEEALSKICVQLAFFLARCPNKQVETTMQVMLTDNTSRWLDQKIGRIQNDPVSQLLLRVMHQLPEVIEEFQHDQKHFVVDICRHSTFVTNINDFIKFHDAMSFANLSMQPFEHLEPSKRHFFLDVFLRHHRLVHDLLHLQQNRVIATQSVVNGEEQQRLIPECVNILPRSVVGKRLKQKLRNEHVLLVRVYSVLVSANEDNWRNGFIFWIHSMHSNCVEPKGKKVQVQLKLATVDVWGKPFHIEHDDINTFATNVEVVEAIEGVLPAIVPARQP
mmetsp:Transcript_100298/g.161710  ORF Transcript_100298/g.161710 Transcript_100298/m.161710 type:complete len:289 (-) Transcript_100298:187-1053(-)